MKIPSLPGFNPEAFEKYFKNTGWLLMARVGALFLKMLVTAIALPNYLGAELNGALNYPLVYVSFFLAISGLGLDTFITRELIKYPEKRTEILGTSFGLRVISGILMIPIIILSFMGLREISQNMPDTPLLHLGIVSLICVFQSLFIIDNVFQSTVQGKQIMKVQVGGNSLSALFKILLIFFNAPLISFIIMLSLDVIILSLGYVWLYQIKYTDINKWKFNPEIAKNLLKKSWPLAFSALFVTLYMKIDQMMIAAMIDKTALGIYTPAISISEAWYFVPMAIITSLFPAIIRLRDQNIVHFKKRMQNLYDLMVWMGFIVAIITSILTPFLYDLLYIDEYAEGANVLVIHIWAGIFISLSLANGQYLLAEGYTKIMLIRSLIGALINTTLNFYWIPIYGIQGAAFATVVAYACSAFFGLLIPKIREQSLMMLQSLLLFPFIIRNLKLLRKD